MAKRKKAESRHTSLRLAPDTFLAVERMAADTGWSVARVVGFLADAGRLAVGENKAGVETARTQFQGAIRLQKVVAENAKRLADAKKMIKSGGLFPDRPAGERKPAAKPGSAPSTPKKLPVDSAPVKG